MTESDIREALRACFDSEYALDVVELGMIAQIDLQLDPDAPGSGIPGVAPRQRLRLALLRGDSPAADDKYSMLQAQILNRLAGLEPLSEVEIKWLPGWTADRMSGEARRKLGLGDPLFPILNGGRR